MVRPDSGERAGKELSFILFVLIPRESTGPVGHSKKTAGVAPRQVRSHSRHIPEGRGKAGSQFPDVDNFRGSWSAGASLVVSYLGV